MTDVKLFVCCHKPFPVPEHPLLVPIQVGAALTESGIPGALRDDVGENISAKNRSYCELTAQYWAWKNATADYFGFFHYRRYLYPDTAEKRPYRIDGAPTENLLDRLNFDILPGLLTHYDLILPKGEDMYLPAREHYAWAPYHHGKDLTLAEEIVRELSPTYSEPLANYLAQSVCYFGNIFIMPAGLFDRYCSWLFPILAEFDRRVHLTGYGPQELRVDGYLAERLLGGFVYQLRAEGLRTLELPRVELVLDSVEQKKRNILNALLPPGTRRRAMAKKLCKR